MCPAALHRWRLDPLRSRGRGNTHGPRLGCRVGSPGGCKRRGDGLDHRCRHGVCCRCRERRARTCREHSRATRRSCTLASARPRGYSASPCWWVQPSAWRVLRADASFVRYTERAGVALQAGAVSEIDKLAEDDLVHGVLQRDPTDARALLPTRRAAWAPRPLPLGRRVLPPRHRARSRHDGGAPGSRHDLRVGGPARRTHETSCAKLGGRTRRATTSRYASAILRSAQSRRPRTPRPGPRRPQRRTSIWSVCWRATTSRNSSGTIPPTTWPTRASRDAWGTSRQRGQHSAKRSSVVGGRIDAAPAELLLESFRLAEAEAKGGDAHDVVGILTMALLRRPTLAARIRKEAQSLLALGAAREREAKSKVDLRSPDSLVTKLDTRGAAVAFNAASLRVAALLLSGMMDAREAADRRPRRQGKSVVPRKRGVVPRATCLDPTHARARRGPPHATGCHRKTGGSLRGSRTGRAACGCRVVAHLLSAWACLDRHGDAGPLARWMQRFGSCPAPSNETRRPRNCTCPWADAYARRADGDAAHEDAAQAESHLLDALALAPQLVVRAREVPSLLRLGERRAIVPRPWSKGPLRAVKSPSHPRRGLGAHANARKTHRDLRRRGQSRARSSRRGCSAHAHTRARPRLRCHWDSRTCQWCDPSGPPTWCGSQPPSRASFPCT